tara:strand:+ start:253 stop:591 length:339 start_codon:yes stop_codon:yes gene_type:complete
MSSEQFAKALAAYAASGETRLADVTRRRAEQIVQAARRRVYATRQASSGPSRLAESLMVEPLPDATGYQVITRVPHARFVEFGTRHMAARPFLTPAVAEVRDRPEKLPGGDT